MDFSVASQVGLRSAVLPSSSAGLGAGTERVAVGEDHQVEKWSPHNPLLWLGGLMAVTVGLASVAGSVRLGKAKVSASVGKA